MTVEGAESREHSGRVNDTAGTRLARLQESASAAYAAIMAADAALQVTAEWRVAAERVLRDAAAQRHVASLAVAAHARARPGLLPQLASRFQARREWRDRRAVLDGALIEATRPIAAAERALDQAKEEFAVRLAERAKAVSALRRLTAECVAARAEIARDPARPPDPLDATASPVGD